MATVETTVGVQQSSTPDRLIDNLQRQNASGQLVDIQRTADVLNSSEYPADINGTPGTTASFAFTKDAHAVYLRPIGTAVRVGVGFTPDNTHGSYIGDGETFVIPRAVLAATLGTTVTVYFIGSGSCCGWSYSY
jgi:hypothetical protein